MFVMRLGQSYDVETGYLQVSAQSIGLPVLLFCWRKVGRNVFLITSTFLVIDRIEHLPLALHTSIALHLNLALAPFEASFHIARDEIVEEKRIRTF